MSHEWCDTFAEIGFRPHGDLGAMRAVVEDVEYVAIPHPLKGVAIICTHISARSAAQFENFVPADATREEVASVMVKAFEWIHPMEG